MQCTGRQGVWSHYLGLSHAEDVLACTKCGQVVEMRSPALIETALVAIPEHEERNVLVRPGDAQDISSLVEDRLHGTLGVALEDFTAGISGEGEAPGAEIEEIRRKAVERINSGHQFFLPKPLEDSATVVLRQGMQIIPKIRKFHVREDGVLELYDSPELDMLPIAGFAKGEWISVAIEKN